jgi:quinol monooxygenase YgiN
VFLFEQWDSQTSLDAHMASPELAAFATALGPAVAGGVDATKFEVASSAPLF